VHKVFEDGVVMTITEKGIQKIITKFQNEDTWMTMGEVF
jgi:hypothetical protein